MGERPTDFNDLHCVAGLAEVRRQINKALEDEFVSRETSLEEMQNPTFPFRSFSDIRSNLKGAQYLIKPYIERSTTNFIYGDSGNLKTFLVHRIAFSIGAGIDFFGIPVKRGAVFIIQGEGVSQSGKRIIALARDSGVDEADIFMSEIPGAIINEVSCASIAATIKGLSESHGVAPALVIFDTFSTNIGDGDETSNADVSRAIVNVNAYIRDALGVAVIIVHHVGHENKTRERGAYAIRANADARILVERLPGSMVCTMICKKVRDGAEWEPVSFKARVFELPDVLDSEGEASSTLVLDITDQAEPELDKPIGSAQAKLLDLLIELYDEHQAKIDQANLKTKARVSVSEWRRENGIRGTTSPKNFARSMKALLDAEKIYQDSGYVYVSY